MNSDDVDKLSVDLDDLQDNESDDDAVDLSKDNRKSDLQSLAYNPLSGVTTENSS